MTIEDRTGYEAVIRVRLASGAEKFLSQAEVDRLEFSEPDTFRVPWPTEEVVTAYVFNVETTIFTQNPDTQVLLQSMKAGRFDVVFTDRRCLFFPVKGADFWKHLDWVQLGRLGGVLGVFVAGTARATVDGIKALLKVQHKYMTTELDELVRAADAEVVGYDRILSVEGHKQKRSLMQAAYFDAADISVHITTRTDGHPRDYAVTLAGGEKAVRSFLSTTGINKPLQMGTAS